MPQNRETSLRSPPSPFPALDSPNLTRAPRPNLPEGMIPRVMRFLKAIRDLGVSPGMDSDLARNVQVTNLFAVFHSFMTFPYFFLLLYLKAYLLTACVPALMGIYGLACLLNRSGFYDVSRLLLLSAINVAIFLYTHILGEASGIGNVFFFSLMSPFVLFHISEWRKILFCLVQPAVFWMLLQGPFGFGDETPLSLSQAHVFFLCINATTSILVVSCTFLIYYSHQQSLVLLRAAKEAAEESSRVKSDFLATISHEIRTPMNGILGSLQLIDNSSLSSKQRGYLEIAQSCGNLLVTIIKDILDFSRVDSGELQLESVDLDLAAILAEIAELLKPEAVKNGLEIALDIELQCPSRVRGDPTRLRQIVLNLVSNAVKFTKKGKVIIALRKVDESEESARIAIAVSDTGIGIPREKISRLFQAFTQLDSSMGRAYGGTGLGLAMARRLAQRMEGHLGVESRVGEGSTFTFTASFPKSSAEAV